MKALGCTVFAALLLASCASHRVLLQIQAPATLGDEPNGHELATVTRVVDGDTIEVVITGRVAGPGAGRAPDASRVSVRLLGIDTPESVDPRRPDECFGKEATAATTALLEDRSVRLVKDVEETDDFGRLLRYVYIGAEMANARLVANGYATAYAYSPNTRHSGLLTDLHRDAQKEHRGLWSPNTCNGQT